MRLTSNRYNEIEKEVLALKLEPEQYGTEIAYNRAEGRAEGKAEGREEGWEVAVLTLISNQRNAGASESTIYDLLKVSFNLTDDEINRYLNLI